jgi:hypothetical protein
MELVGDLVAPYGVALRPDVSGGHSYGEMLAGLIGDLVVPSAEPVDALILGFAMPDVWPDRATATYLSHVCPGSPLAFAVCDQGIAAGFTALRLARDYAASGACRRVLVALAEQTRLDYDPPAPALASVPDRHAAFAMLCEAGPLPAPAAGGPGGDGPPSLRAVRVLPGVPAAEVPGILHRELAALSAEPGEEKRTLVLGQGLAGLTSGDAPDLQPVLDLPSVPDWGSVPGWRTVPLAPGQPLTGAWRELAAWAALPDRGGLAIADYDPGLRYLCLAVFAGS